mgnify:CR=1 FL=1
MSVSKRDIKEIKSIYKENPMEVRKVLDGQLIHLKRNIRILQAEIEKIEPALEQTKKDHLSFTKKRSDLIVKQLDGSPLTNREKEMLKNINEEINDLHEYTSKERPRFRTLKIDLDVNLSLKKKVETLLDAIKPKRKNNNKN